jgi:hypothetical protein
MEEATRMRMTYNTSMGDSVTSKQGPRHNAIVARRGPAIFGQIDLNGQYSSERA